MLGISTCWWYTRTLQGDTIPREALDLGLDGLELEYRITEPLYHQMKPYLKENMRVFSIHNYFPFPKEAPGGKGSGDLFLLSSTDQEERLKAVQYTIRTMDHAHELGVGAVILHLGRVEMPYQRASISSPDFVKDLRPIREARHGEHLHAVLRSLEGLNREAEWRGLFLGIENRYHFNEIPDFEELRIILDRFKGGNVGYWHDVGHAAAQEKMGIIPQRRLLEEYGERLIGIHLHDIRGLSDHLAPGKGALNFAEIKPFLKPSHLKIIEVHPHVSREDLTQGIRFLREEGIC
ncbi:MAG: sugar phosphate isomerase/epimerase [Pseudomonadota bacterium]